MNKKFLYGLSLMTGLLLTPAINAGTFYSIHQAQLKIALPPPAGSYEYSFMRPIGFKQQYAPSGVTGCNIGYAVSGCAFKGGGSLPLPEFTGYQLQYKEFKIFIPKGSKTIMLSGFAPQGSRSAFVIRYGAEPVRQASLNDNEYSVAQVKETIDKSL